MSRKNKNIGAKTVGVRAGWERVTIVIPETFHEAMKMIAWYDREPVQNEYATAIYEYLNKQKPRSEQILKAYHEHTEEDK